MALLNLSQYYSNSKQNEEVGAQVMKSIENNDNDKGSALSKNPVVDETSMKPSFSKDEAPGLILNEGMYVDRSNLPTDLKKTDPKITSSDQTASNPDANGADAGKGKGVNYGAAGVEVAKFGMDIYSASQASAQSDKESDARTLKLAATGLTTGATIGSLAGPVGTAIGAAAGAIIGASAGMLMKVPDRKKRIKKANEEYNQELLRDVQTRRALEEDFNKQQEIEQLADLKKSQMGLMNIKY